jgi:hypothetical protein
MNGMDGVETLVYPFRRGDGFCTAQYVRIYGVVYGESVFYVG